MNSQVNKTLKALDLTLNGLGPEGGILVAEALQVIPVIMHAPIYRTICL
jgi:hypothetical protein